MWLKSRLIRNCMLQQCPGQKSIEPNMCDCFIFSENENCVVKWFLRLTLTDTTAAIMVQPYFLYLKSSTCQSSWIFRFNLSVTYPDGSFVAVDPSDSQPGRQVKHVLQNLLIKLEVGQLPFPLQCAEVDLVWGQILGEPERRTQEKG